VRQFQRVVAGENQPTSRDKISEKGGGGGKSPQQVENDVTWGSMGFQGRGFLGREGKKVIWEGLKNHYDKKKKNLFSPGYLAEKAYKNERV